MEQLAEEQRKQHVHRHDDQRVNEQHRRLGEDADNRGRRADDRKKDVDQKGADLVGARRVVERLGEGGGADHGQGGHNQVLVAQQLVEDKARALGGEEPGEKVCDRGRDRHDEEGRRDVKGDILQRDGLCLPEFPGAAALPGLHLVDQRVGVVPAEKGDGRHGNQHKEVERHQQVVRHHRLGTHLPGSAEGVGHRDKVDRAADIGAGEHGGHLVQLREQVVQQNRKELAPVHRKNVEYPTSELHSDHWLIKSVWLPFYQEPAIMHEADSRNAHRQAVPSRPTAVISFCIRH